MNPQEQLEEYFQRCNQCGRWEPRTYLKDEKKHQCPEDKSLWIPKKFENGKHTYNSIEVKIDWEINMVNSIVGQILNNVECKTNYVRILSIAMMKIEEILRMQNEM